MITKYILRVKMIPTMALSIVRLPVLSSVNKRPPKLHHQAYQMYFMVIQWGNHMLEKPEGVITSRDPPDILIIMQGI